MKQLLKLQEKIEKEFDVQFSDFPGVAQENGYYYPKVIGNEKSTRFWIIFNATELESYCIFGDFKLEKKKKYPIKTSLGSLKISTKEPSNEEYLKQRQSWREKADKILESCEYQHHPYFDPVKVKGFKQRVKGRKALIPYYDLRSKKIEAVLRIDEKGGKFLTPGSQPKNSIHFLQLPKDTKVIYICEGIKTAYAILKCSSEEVGIISVGGISNLENVITHFKEKFDVIICTEKGSHPQYLELKHKYKTKIVGDPEFGDIADYLKEHGEKKTEHLLNTFKSSMFIPLGFKPDTNSLRVYIKEKGGVLTYNTQEVKNLYVDCHGLSETPSKEACEEFYFEQRSLARKLKPPPKYAEVSVGIFKRGKRYYFFDGESCYLLTDEGVTKVEMEDLISPETLFKKEGYRHKVLTDFKDLSFEDVQRIISAFCKVCVFDNAIEHKLCLGWVVQAILCGGIPFRSHLWITGDFSSGKSTFVTDFMLKLLCFFEKRVGRETTAKWVERAFDKKAIPFYHDEFEPSKNKTHDSSNMLELHRSTATERYASVGKAMGASSEKLEFTFCYAAIITSIETLNELKNEDVSRFIFMTLRKNFTKQFTTFMTKYDDWTKDENIKYKLLITCLRRFHLFLSEYKYFTDKLSLTGISMHKVRSVSNLVAGYNILVDKKDRITIEDATDYLDKFKASYEVVGVSFFESLMNSLVNRNLWGGLQDKYLKDILASEDDRDLIKDYMVLKNFKGSQILYIFHSSRPFIQDIIRRNSGYLRLDSVKIKIEEDRKYLIAKKVSARTEDGRRRWAYKFDIGKFWETL